MNYAAPPVGLAVPAGKSIDLFAGPGGLSLGLIGAGFEVVGAVEWDPHAGRTYRHNIGNHVHVRDLTSFGPKEMELEMIREGRISDRGEVCLISGGPPCPGFSMIGRSKISSLIASGEWEGSDARHGFIDDERNKLFREFVKYVDHFRPRFFLMENVSGMTSYMRHKGGSIVDVIESEFQSLGYSVKSEVLMASKFGVPQNRRRIIFMGWGEVEAEPEWPLEEEGELTAWDAIRDLPQVDDETGLSRSSALSDLSALKNNSMVHSYLGRVRNSVTPTNLRGGGVSLHHTRPVNARDRGIFPLLKSGEGGGKRVLYKDLDPSTIGFPEPWRWVKSRGVVSNGRRGASKKEYKWYDGSKFGDKMRRMRGDRPAPTVVAHLAKDGYMFIHPYEDRTITVREAARFQSFPDSFDFSADGKNPVSSQFRQVGNAVPPILAESLGRCIISAMERS